LREEGSDQVSAGNGEDVLYCVHLRSCGQWDLLRCPCVLYCLGGSLYLLAGVKDWHANLARIKSRGCVTKLASKKLRLPRGWQTKSSLVLIRGVLSVLDNETRPSCLHTKTLKRGAASKLDHCSKPRPSPDIPRAYIPNTA
jgi:hypothetical protein